MSAVLPTKLKDDAIVEALLEIQFDSDDLGEIVIGRLTDFDLWNGYSVARLSAANIPENIRDADPSLRFQPVIERRSQDERSNVRIGSHVLSYHVYVPYPGWVDFKPRLDAIVEELFNKMTNLQVTRLGFRYINYLQSGKHHIGTSKDLSLNIQLGGQSIVSGFNLSYIDAPSKHHYVLTKVASPDFVEVNQRPVDLVCAADIDVFSTKDFVTDNLSDVVSWIDEAHTIEKEAFFCLFEQSTINKLNVES